MKIKRAVVTERTTELKNTRNQIVFEVSSRATKTEIKKEVEKAFKVKVDAVNTMLVRGKLKTMGRYQGRKPAWKKAIVTLKKGHTIELMEGV